MGRLASVSRQRTWLAQIAHCDSWYRDGETAPAGSTRSWSHVCWRRSLPAKWTLLLLAGVARSLQAARRRRPVGRRLVGGRPRPRAGRAASARCLTCSRRLGEQGPSRGLRTRLGGPLGELRSARGTRCLRPAGRQRRRSRRDSRHRPERNDQMSTTLDNERVRELAGRVSGPVLAPQQAGYDAARARPQRPRRPQAGADRPLPDDRATSSRPSRSRAAAGLEVSVRGGGHNVAGRAVTDGGVMIDLAEMKDDRRRSRARRPPPPQGGVTWAELNDAAAAHGLAVTGGAVSTTGIAGYTLGGGLGWLMAKYGLAADNLLARRARHRRRRGARRRRRLAPRPVLGAARRRRQLRRRDVVHLPPAPARDGHRRADRPPDRGRARAAALLPRRGRRRVGRPDRVRRARARAGRLRRQARGAGRLPRRRPGGGRARARAVQDVGIAADGRGRARCPTR